MGSKVIEAHVSIVNDLLRLHTVLRVFCSTSCTYQNSVLHIANGHNTHETCIFHIQLSEALYESDS